MEEETRMHKAARISAALSGGGVTEVQRWSVIGVTIIGFIPFDEAPTVYVYNLALATSVTAKHIETADALAESF